VEYTRVSQILMQNSPLEKHWCLAHTQYIQSHTGPGLHKKKVQFSFHTLQCGKKQKGGRETVFFNLLVLVYEHK